MTRPGVTCGGKFLNAIAGTRWMAGYANVRLPWPVLWPIRHLEISLERLWFLARLLSMRELGSFSERYIPLVSTAFGSKMTFAGGLWQYQRDLRSVGYSSFGGPREYFSPFP